MRIFILIFLISILWCCEQIEPTKLGEPITNYKANINYQVNVDGILSVSFSTPAIAHDRGVAIYLGADQSPTETIGELHVVPIITRDVKIEKNQYFRVETRGESISVNLIFRPIL